MKLIHNTENIKKRLRDTPERRAAVRSGLSGTRWRFSLFHPQETSSLFQTRFIRKIPE
ncbi:hypothetical protein [Paenibacillus sp. USDA918EY]|uniref:hypothetical protein n=1 Tax=Paenibacillus sp. USDA918EY TaxID=2689575 RepID=UPI001F488A3C|nr:hypothetical protein [Paenibacillus sp. USDA918EY]